MNELETVIGLEVHAQLDTQSKIFCSCAVSVESPANTNICPVCCGYPGVLPVFNQRALELAVRVSLGLHCDINSRFYFERKNYFYPDLPKNYQISQYQQPLGFGGYLELASGKKVRITRVHLEEDAGKLIHRQDCSLVDFNRTGTALLEIVSEPDIASPEEAYDYLNYLKLTLQYLKASSCDMEKGSLRCDANISLRPRGSTTLGTKVELKNMNTFRGVRLALEFEAKRQAQILARGENLVQETRLWDAEKLATYTMRTKEAAHDYRYFPEPDLLDFSVAPELIGRQKQNIGELPLARLRRFMAQYQLSEKDTDVFIADSSLAEFFEAAVKVYPQVKELVNWMLGPFLEQLNSLAGGMKAVKLSPEKFVTIVRYFSEGKLNNLAAKKVLALSIATDDDIDMLIERENLAQVSGQDELAGFIRQAAEENPRAVTEYCQGKQEAIQFLVGQVMRKTKGKANPKIARQMLEAYLREHLEPGK